MTKKRRWWIALAVVSVSAVVTMAVELFDRGPGIFWRWRYEAVVRAVREKDVAPGVQRSFRLDGERLVDVADETPERGRGAGRVWAKKTDSGHLRVVIESRDRGHAGEYGFAYSEDAQEPRSTGMDPWLTLDVPGRAWLVKPEDRIDEHWWRVTYNLD